MGGGQVKHQRLPQWRRTTPQQACYRGDQDLQSLLFRAGVFGPVNHRACWPAAVQLRPESQISHNISSRDKAYNYQTHVETVTEVHKGFIHPVVQRGNSSINTCAALI